MNRSGLFMQLNDIARKHQARIVYAEGENEDVLLAVSTGRGRRRCPADSHRAYDRDPRTYGQAVDASREIGRDVLVVDPQEADTNPRYWECYHGMVGRQGVSVAAARMAMRSNASRRWRRCWSNWARPTA